MRKLQGSLGFTLRKEDDSALGHYIRALVREPALTDSRIRAGDKIIAVSLKITFFSPAYRTIPGKQRIMYARVRLPNSVQILMETH